MPDSTEVSSGIQPIMVTWKQIKKPRRSKPSPGWECYIVAELLVFGLADNTLVEKNLHEILNWSWKETTWSCKTKIRGKSNKCPWQNRTKKEIMGYMSKPLGGMWVQLNELMCRQKGNLRGWVPLGGFYGTIATNAFYACETDSAKHPPKQWLLRLWSDAHLC